LLQLSQDGPNGNDWDTGKHADLMIAQLHGREARGHTAQP
jgi:hypothetical protein